MMIRIFFLRVSDGKPCARLSEYETPEKYATAVQLIHDAVCVAWESDTPARSAVGTKRELWIPRCKEAIDAGRFFGSKGEALAARAAVRLQS